MRLRVEDVTNLTPQERPYRLRISMKTEGIFPGDYIRVRARLTPPLGPALPGGYDPARRAFFEKVGGYGFAFNDPERIDPDQRAYEGEAHIGKESFIIDWQRRWVRFRYQMAEHIRKEAPPATAGLQAALLTGVRAYIPETQTQVLRDTGLAHILAISGLHMGLSQEGLMVWRGLRFCIFTVLRATDLSPILSPCLSFPCS